MHKIQTLKTSKASNREIMTLRPPYHRAHARKEKGLLTLRSTLQLTPYPLIYSLLDATWLTTMSCPCVSEAIRICWVIPRSMRLCISQQFTLVTTLNHQCQYPYNKFEMAGIDSRTRTDRVFIDTDFLPVRLFPLLPVYALNLGAPSHPRVKSKKERKTP